MLTLNLVCKGKSYGVAGFLGGSHIPENVCIRRVIASPNWRAMRLVGMSGLSHCKGLRSRMFEAYGGCGVGGECEGG